MLIFVLLFGGLLSAVPLLGAEPSIHRAQVKNGTQPVVLHATALECKTPSTGGGDIDKPPRRADQEPGKTRFESYCAACHQRGGTGIEGRVPPLKRSPWVAGPESRLVRIVLHGLRGPIEIDGKTFNMEMPGFYLFTDEEIASLLSFVRKRYGGPSPPITAASVRKIRAATRSRTGYWTVDELLDVP